MDDVIRSRVASHCCLPEGTPHRSTAAKSCDCQEVVANNVHSAEISAQFQQHIKHGTHSVRSSSLLHSIILLVGLGWAVTMERHTQSWAMILLMTL